MRRTNLAVLGLVGSSLPIACAESAIREIDIQGASANDANPRDAGEALDGAALEMDAMLPPPLAPGSDASAPDAQTGGGPPSMSHDGGKHVGETERAAFFGEPRCGREPMLLCEDFESEAPGQRADPAVWQTMGDRLVVDETRAARGNRSLHVITGSRESLHFVRTTRIVPAASDKMWGRLFLWIEAPRPQMFSHWTVIEATGPHPSGGTARVRFGGIHIPKVENRLEFNYDVWAESRPAGFREVGRELHGKDTADGKWHCLEWMFDVVQREARLFRDGVEEEGLRAAQSVDGVVLDFPSFDGLNIGFANYQPLGAGDRWNVWIDEVAVDTARIGCAR